MKSRTSKDGVEVHKKIEPRIYDGCGIQGARIDKARQVLLEALSEDCADDDLEIIELGCGTGDISGYISGGFPVMGFDCNEGAIEVARQRFPQGHWHAAEIDKLEPMKSRVLVLCEFLEHLHDPESLVKKWLPKAEHVVISHPLDEPLDSRLSAGEHQWSFDYHDLVNWLAIGGHKVCSTDIFTMGLYRIGIVRGRRLPLEQRTDHSTGELAD